MDEKSPQKFKGPFSIQPIILFLFVLFFLLLEWIWLENAVEGSWGVYSVNSMPKFQLRYIITITNNLLWWSRMTYIVTIKILLEGGQVEVWQRQTTTVADDDCGG